MSSQKASNIENIQFGPFSRSINSNMQHCSGVSLSFLVTPTNFVLITGKKINGTFHPFRNNRHEKSRKKTEEAENFRSY